MKFPVWAPPDLVDYYNSFPDEPDLYIKDEKEMVFRLLTRPEMESVWIWYNQKEHMIGLTKNGGMIGRFLLAYDEFKYSAKASNSERKQDFLEIKKLASKLSVKLKKYSNEPLVAFNSYRSIIPSEYDSPLIESLKEEYQEKIRQATNNKTWLREFPFWDEVIPPMHTLMDNLSKVAGRVDPESHSLPKKINQKTSLQTHLIASIYKYRFYYLHDDREIPAPIVATIVSVALDDASVTADNVRKIIANRNIKGKN